MTPVTKLRKEAPGSLTAAAVAVLFKRWRYPRDARTIGAFERGEFQNPPERFVELYARAVHCSIDTVRTALVRTQRMREKGIGPFGSQRVA